MTQGIMWVDGRLVPADQAHVSARDHGFVVGDGVFEAAKIVHGQVFALRRHLARMARSAAGMGLPVPDAETVTTAVQAVLIENSELLTTGWDLLRITWTDGVGPLGSPRGEGPPTLTIGVTPGHAPDPSTTVITVPWRRNEHGALTGLKTTSYGENVMALARARAAGSSEALFANTAGMLCEGTGSNVFVVRGGQVSTPPLSAGPLAGVTRALVLEWSPVTEQDMPMDALFEAEEVFLTSSGRDVQAVTRVDDHQVSDGVGPVTARVAAAFAAGQARSLEP